jgi:hypothetical protein
VNIHNRFPEFVELKAGICWCRFKVCYLKSARKLILQKFN